MKTYFKFFHGLKIIKDNYKNDYLGVQVKVKVEQNDVIPKSRVKIRSSQCSKLIQKVTKSYVCFFSSMFVF